MPRSPEPVAALDRLDPWATTGVGSLPFEDPATAVSHAVSAYDVPFCPQLPRVEGDMVVEWLGADPSLCGWSPERDRERPRAWSALSRVLAATPPAHGVVKLQATGPVTLAAALARAGGTPPAADPGLRRELATWLAANVAGMVAALRECGLDAILVVDEPLLDRAVETPGLERTWDPLRATGAAFGLHVCCAVPWALMDRAEPDLLSFDLVRAPVGARGGAVLARLLARGGRVAWGVLPVHRHEPPMVARARLAGALARCGEATGERSLLTASCGTGRLTPERETEVASRLRALATDLRASAAAAAPA